MFNTARIKFLESEVTRCYVRISDLEAQNERLQSAYAVERKDLLEKIMSLSRPEALREFKRPATPIKVLNDRPPIAHFPGYRPSTRPPSPPQMMPGEVPPLKPGA